jgi:5-methylcytosine-specific restriction endonuclease McrA
MSREWKYEVHQRDNYTCQHCGAMEDPTHLTFQVHHIVYRCLGGGDNLENLVLTCPECHKYYYHGMGYPQGHRKHRRHRKHKRK